MFKYLLSLYVVLMFFSACSGEVYLYESTNNITYTKCKTNNVIKEVIIHIHKKKQKRKKL